MGYCFACGLINKHTPSCKHNATTADAPEAPDAPGHPDAPESPASPTGSFAERASDSTKNVSLTLSQRRAVRWGLVIATTVCAILGIALLAAGATSLRGYGMVVGGIIFLCLAVVVPSGWAIGACCCGHLWCCSPHA